LHRLLRLPVRTAFEPLSNSVLLRLQLQWKDCRFIFIDEKSMLGLRQLYWIDCRLRQIFPQQSDIPFGGLNIVLFGDFCQLPPVCELALYDTRPKHSLEITAGQSLYQLFDRTVILDQIMRQQGQDDESVQFRAVLEDLRQGIITDNNCEFLQQRVRNALPPEV
jgi:hypothetical protein